MLRSMVLLAIEALGSLRNALALVHYCYHSDELLTDAGRTAKAFGDCGVTASLEGGSNNASGERISHLRAFGKQAFFAPFDLNDRLVFCIVLNVDDHFEASIDPTLPSRVFHGVACFFPVAPSREARELFRL